ncbi:hypothetical protein BX666DRAFT_2031916 [Dichotomocladium elegans]|nr:hypothetical protein BX666DRAFT_2031916 [Dichotomocladium elegans]
MEMVVSPKAEGLSNFNAIADVAIRHLTHICQLYLPIGCTFQAITIYYVAAKALHQGCHDRLWIQCAEKNVVVFDIRLYAIMADQLLDIFTAQYQETIGVQVVRQDQDE